MTLETRINAGTITLEQGSQTVTGAQTNWKLNGARAGDLFIDRQSGAIGIIDTVVSDTQMSLIHPWAHATRSDAEFDIIPLELLTRTAENSTKLRELLEQLETAAPGEQGQQGAQSRILLSEATISDDAEVDVSGFDSGHAYHVVEVLNLVPATDRAALRFRVSTDGGATVEDGSHYRRFLSTGSSAGFTNTAYGTADSYGRIQSGIQTGNGAAASYSALITCFAAASTTLHKLWHVEAAFIHELSANAGRDTGALSWRPDTPAAYDTMRFSMDTGNMASGKIRVFGMT